MIYVCQHGWPDNNIILITDNIRKAIKQILWYSYKNKEFDTITIQVWQNDEKLITYGPGNSLIREYQPDPFDVLKELETEIGLALIGKHCGEEFSL